MSGSAGGNRIPRSAVEKTVQEYIDKVLSKVPGFKSAKVSGSYNTSAKQDFGDIDLITSFEGEDKKEFKKQLAKYLESLPDDTIVPFKSEKYKGKKTMNTGEIVTILYPIAGMPDEFVQIDNIIALSEEEGDFKKTFLDYPAEIQGLILGLVKVVTLEEDPNRVLAKMGIKNIPALEPNQEYEFNLSSAGLTLRIVTLDEDYKQLDRTEVWKSSNWSDVKKLLSNYNLNQSFNDLVSDLKKLKNPRSKNRIKGIFKSMVSIKSGEVNTPKGDNKQMALDTVATLEEKYGSFIVDLIRPILEAEIGKQTIAVFPGAFKPPHASHLKAIQVIAPKVNKVYVYVSKQPRVKEGQVPVDASQAMAVWDLYKQKGLIPDNVEIKLAQNPTPVLDAYQEFEAHPENKYLAVFGKDEEDRWKSVEKNKEKYGHVTPVNIGNLKGLSASGLRTAIKNKDLKAIETFLPKGVTAKEYIQALSKGKKEDLTEAYKGKRTNNGAPGTFKAKITKAYGGDVTIEKAKKFKNRENATPLDKQQANWFINFHSKNESVTPAELKQADAFADTQLAPVDVDLTSKHVFDRLTGRESDITFAQLIGFFKRLGRNKKEFFEFFKKYDEIVANDKTTNLNIPFLNMTNKAIAKTIMRKPNFMTSSPKMTFEELNEVGEANLQPYKWEETGDMGATVTTKFVTDKGTKYEVNITATRFIDNESVNHPVLDIDFGVEDENDSEKVPSATIVTNKGELYKVMSTIVDIVKYYLELTKGRFKSISYTPSKKRKERFGSQRDNLYRAFISKAFPEAKIQKVGEDILVTLPDNRIQEKEGKAAPYGSGYEPLEEEKEQTEGLYTTDFTFEPPVQKELEPLIEELTNYMVEQGLNITPAPKVEFVEDEDNAKNTLGRTAYYDPNNKVIVLYVTNRHPKDILRSFAHEMIHHCQNLEGRLGGINTTNINEDDYLADIESEAYNNGNMIFRAWENDREGNNSIRNMTGFTPGSYDIQPINEGAYDSVTRTVVKDIMAAWKEEYNGQEGKLSFEEEYETQDAKGRPLDFALSADLLVQETEEGIYKVDGGANAESQKKDDDDEDEPDLAYLEIRFQVDPRSLPQFWSRIYEDLIDVVRHEIEHLTQMGVNLVPAKETPDDEMLRQMIDWELLPKADYFRLQSELEPMLQGMYLKAKKTRTPFRDVLNNYLDMQDITPEDKENILNLWRTKRKSLSLPEF
jgi:hypothetical protein